MRVLHFRRHQWRELLQFNSSNSLGAIRVPALMLIGYCCCVLEVCVIFCFLFGVTIQAELVSFYGVTINLFFQRRNYLGSVSLVSYGVTIRSLFFQRGNNLDSASLKAKIMSVDKENPDHYSWSVTFGIYFLRFLYIQLVRPLTNFIYFFLFTFLGWRVRVDVTTTKRKASTLITYCLPPFLRVNNTCFHVPSAVNPRQSYWAPTRRSKETN